MPSTFHCSLYDPFQVLSSPSYFLFEHNSLQFLLEYSIPQTSDMWSDLSSRKGEGHAVAETITTQSYRTQCYAYTNLMHMKKCIH